MMPARISPVGKGREEPLFECGRCDGAEMAIVEDPLKSKAADGLAANWKRGLDRPLISHRLKFYEESRNCSMRLHDRQRY
jgi:hypothetical protein